MSKPHTNSNKAHLMTVFREYEQNFLAAVDAALTNPVYRDDPEEKPASIEGNKVLFTIGKQFKVLCMVSIHEKKYEKEWYWRAVVYMLVVRSGLRHKEPLWTRRHRLIMRNIGLAFFLGVGEPNEEVRHGTENSMFIFTKDASHRDVEVVKKLEEKLSRQNVQSNENNEETDNSGVGRVDDSAGDLDKLPVLSEQS